MVAVVLWSIAHVGAATMLVMLMMVMVAHVRRLGLPIIVIWVAMVPTVCRGPVP